jgi:SAM-dependent methyltransferase
MSTRETGYGVESDPLVTREQVTAAYRFILGREPECEEVIRRTASHYKTFDALRQGLLASTEFATQFARIRDQFPLDLSAGERVDVTTDDPTLNILLGRIAQAWASMGTDDPYWSVLSSPIYSRENFARNEETFWQSGEHDVKRFLIWLERNHVSASPGWSVLEFGCGTGRITRYLGQRFDSVWGCDISEPHLRLARDAVRRFAARNIGFIHIESMATLDELPAVDAIFSIIVLQHNPPPVIAHILDKLLKTLRVGGIAYFQVPTRSKGYTFNVYEYLKSDLNLNMEVHVLPQRYIFDIISANACDVLEVQPDNMLGSPESISNTFLCRKRRPSAQTS